MHYIKQSQEVLGSDASRVKGRGMQEEGSARKVGQRSEQENQSQAPIHALVGALSFKLL